MVIGLEHYLIVAAVLFTLGVAGIILNRKNVIIILMSVELILLSVNLNLVAFSAQSARPDGADLRPVHPHRRGGRSGDRPGDPRHLFPQPRHDRGRRHQHDEGLIDMYLRNCLSSPSRLPDRRPVRAAARRRARAKSSRRRCCSSPAFCPGSIFGMVGFGGAPFTAPVLANWMTSGALKVELGPARRHADRGDAGGGDDGVVARPSLFHRLHARRPVAAALLRLSVAVHLRHADAGDGRQSGADVLRLGRRRPRVLPADRLLV